MTTLEATSLSDAQSSEVPAQPRWLTPGLYGLLAAQWLALCLSVGTAVVYLVSRPPEAVGLTQAGRWELGAAQLLLLVLAASAGAWHLPGLVRRRQFTAAIVLAATTAMYGLGILGLKGMEWALWGEPQVILAAAPVSATGTSQASASSEPVSAIGNAQLGAASFATTCVACHGPKAQGIPNIAPALVGAGSIVADSSDAAVSQVIIAGRSPGDRASKTGKAMPARGGNPFLSDADVANIVAHLRTLSSAGAQATASSSESGPPVVVLPKWVVPPAAKPTSGSGPALLSPPPSPVLPAEIAALQHNPHQRIFGGFMLLLSGMHALQLLLGIGAALGLMWQVYDETGDAESWARFVRFYWLAGLVVWLALTPLLYARW